MKNTILHTIYDIFAQWSAQRDDLQPACKAGCHACCTRNVTMTGLEGENILRYIFAEDMIDWAAERISKGVSALPPKMTTNQFAGACLSDQDIEEEAQDLAPCPFLNDEGLCSIYPVRPFSCRLFVSKVTCGPGTPAEVPEYYLTAATSVSQLIEHLGQKEYWGNMFHVLPALLDASAWKPLADKMNSTLLMQARFTTLTAQPLPGFLLTEEDADKVAPLLEQILDARIEEAENKTINEIFNNR